MFSGIYIIINSVSNKCYIGQSVNVEQRCRRHLINLRGNRHCNKHLQATYNKYGNEAFSFETLEVCEKDIKCLTEAEQYWMDYFKFIGAELYNMTPAAGTCLGYKHSEETKQKKKGQIPWNTGKKASPELREKLSKAHIGRTDSRLGKLHSEETKKRISDKKIGSKLSKETKIKISNGNKGRIFSEETKKKISESRLGKSLSEEHKKNLSKAWKTRTKSNKESSNE